jgi:hypothetical protein
LFQKIILILDEICLIGNPSCFDWKFVIDWAVTQRDSLY